MLALATHSVARRLQLVKSFCMPSTNTERIVNLSTSQVADCEREGSAPQASRSAPPARSEMCITCEEVHACMPAVPRTTPRRGGSGLH